MNTYIYEDNNCMNVICYYKFIIKVKDLKKKTFKGL